MSNVRQKLVLLLMAASLPLHSQVAQKASPSRSSQITAAQSVTTQSSSSSQLSLEQMPASAPQVSFKSGELTIIAKNASLGAILQAVQTETGATIDMPGSVTERVVGEFGPGPSREVLTALLNGSHFNYVLLGSPQDPNSLDRVVLIAKAAGTEDTATGPPPAGSNTAMLPRQGNIIIPPQDPDDNAADTEEMAEPDPNAAAADQSGDQQNAQPAIKTPQQLLQELQRQQQAQQQGQAGTPQGVPQMQGRPPQ